MKNSSKQDIKRGALALAVLLGKAKKKIKQLKLYVNRLDRELADCQTDLKTAQRYNQEYEAQDKLKKIRIKETQDALKNIREEASKVNGKPNIGYIVGRIDRAIDQLDLENLDAPF